MNSGCGGAPSVAQADSNMPHVNGMFETNVQWQSIKPRYRVALFVVQLPLHVFTEAGKEKTAAVYNTNLLKLTNLRTRYLVVSELPHCIFKLSYLEHVSIYLIYLLGPGLRPGAESYKCLQMSYSFILSTIIV